MIITLKINLESLDALCEDPTVIINEIKTDDGHLLIEISKPDPETTPLYMPTESQ